jgi:hypothetical protein
MKPVSAKSLFRRQPVVSDFPTIRKYPVEELGKGRFLEVYRGPNDPLLIFTNVQNASPRDPTGA